MDSHAQLRIGPIFSNAARAVPDRVAAAIDGETLTFVQLDRAANRLCRALLAAGVERGQRVAVWVVPSLDLMPLFAALAKLGAVFVPANPNATAEELDAVLATARPHLLVADRPRAAAAEQAAERSGCPSLVLDDLVAGSLDLDDSEPEVEGPSEEDPHVIFFTSGSTGRPKGAVLSHRVNLLRTHPGSQLEPRGVLVCAYPLFHMSAWTLGLQQWQAHDAMVMVKSDPAAICDAIHHWKAARFNAIPAVWQRILDYLASPEGSASDLSSLRFADSGTSATPLTLLDGIAAAVPGARVRIFYGSTEAGNVAALDAKDFARKPGSCGVPSLLTQIKIADDGQLCSRGPLTFDGYFEDPDANATALIDGWYHSGDLAVVDDEGFLSIVGRASSVIRSGGENVAPTEVEAVLKEHPAVADVAVVGIPHERWGELVCAAVVPTSGSEAPDVEELRRHCTGRLANFKHPRAVVVLDAIPRTPATLQVQRKVVAELAVAALAGQA